MCRGFERQLMRWQASIYGAGAMCRLACRLCLKIRVPEIISENKQRQRWRQRERERRTDGVRTAEGANKTSRLLPPKRPRRSDSLIFHSSSLQIIRGLSLSNTLQMLLYRDSTACRSYSYEWVTA